MRRNNINIDGIAFIKLSDIYDSSSKLIPISRIDTNVIVKNANN